MQWLRLYHDTINDPKWRVVSVRSKQPVGNVLAVWMQMLVCASEAVERGTLEGWDDEMSGAVLGYDPADVSAIRNAMQGLVLDGVHLSGWDKRQRASDNIAERVKRHRKRGKNPDPGGGAGNGHDGAGNGLSRDANDTVTLHSADVTLPPLRATDLQKERSSVANATGRGAPISDNIVQMPLTAEGELLGPVLADLVAAVPDVPAREIRSMLGKAKGHFGPDAALALAKQALLRVEPWSWFCKSVNERCRAPGVAGRRPREAGAQELLDKLEAFRGAL